MTRSPIELSWTAKKQCGLPRSDDPIILEEPRSVAGTVVKIILRIMQNLFSVVAEMFVDPFSK